MRFCKKTKDKIYKFVGERMTEKSADIAMSIQRELNINVSQQTVANIKAIIRRRAMKNEWHFVYYGEPVPKARAKSFYDPKTKRGWKYEPKKSKDFFSALQQEMARKWNRALITNEPVWVVIKAFKSRPKSHYGTGRNAGTIKSSAPEFPMTKPDWDNYGKMVTDAMTGTVIKDDSLIVDGTVRKRFSDRPRIELEVKIGR